MTRSVNQPVLAGPRASRQPLAIRCRDNSHNASAGEGLSLAQRGNPFRDDLTDQPRLVFVEFGRSGIAVPCLFRSFHDPLNSQGAPHDLAR